MSEVYKGYRHERSKGEDNLRTNYWYLLRYDGGEDLAVIGREIKSSGGHYAYASAPLFGMLSWVNSMEVKRWLQAQVTDAMPDTLPPAAVPLPATALLDPSAFAPGMARHNSDLQLQQAQHDLGLPLSGAMESASFGSLPSTAAYLSDGSAADKHRRNGHMGHVLNNVEAQLLDLRRRAGVEYTLTVVTQEREVHVITSPAVTWRKTERGAAWRPGTEGAYPSGMESSAPMSAPSEAGQQAHAPYSSAPQGGHMSDSLCNGGGGMDMMGRELLLPRTRVVEQEEGSAGRGDPLGPPQPDSPTPAWQEQTKRALSEFMYNVAAPDLDTSRKRMATASDFPPVLSPPTMPM